MTRWQSVGLVLGYENWYYQRGVTADILKRCRHSARRLGALVGVAASNSLRCECIVQYSTEKRSYYENFYGLAQMAGSAIHKCGHVCLSGEFGAQGGGNQVPVK